MCTDTHSYIRDSGRSNDLGITAIYVGKVSLSYFQLESFISSYSTH